MFNISVYTYLCFILYSKKNVLIDQKQVAFFNQKYADCSKHKRDEMLAKAAVYNLAQPADLMDIPKYNNKDFLQSVFEFPGLRNSC